MSFIRNAWYVAGWSKDFSQGKIQHKTILEEPVVFFRRQDGTPVALQDRCPHRFVPLHMGRVVDDTIECCYHGLRFDCTGKCVVNPHGDGRIPAAAKVRSYPIEERHSAWWIWMGERPADPSQIPDYSMLDEDADFRASRGYTLMQAAYELVGENLLDLSHLYYLHEGLLGSPEMIGMEAKVRQEGERLHCDRFMPNVSVPEAMDLVFRQDGKPVDMWTNMSWVAPGSFLLDVGVQPPSTSREEGVWYNGVHFLTPETKFSTHYHFGAARPAKFISDDETNKVLAGLRRKAFEEQDKPVIDAQQLMMGKQDFWEMKPVLLSIDAGPVRMRRMILERLEEEKRERDAVGGVA